MPYTTQLASSCAHTVEPPAEQLVLASVRAHAGEHHREHTAGNTLAADAKVVSTLGVVLAVAPDAHRLAVRALNQHLVAAGRGQGQYPCQRVAVRGSRSAEMIRRSANAFAKVPGMCWISSTGNGKSAGNRVRTCCSAAGPPVDVPIATSW